MKYEDVARYLTLKFNSFCTFFQSEDVVLKFAYYTVTLQRNKTKNKTNKNQISIHVIRIYRRVNLHVV